MALALRNVCRIKASPIISNIARLSTSSAVPQLISSPASNCTKQNVLLSSHFQMSPSITRTISVSAPRFSALGKHSTLWTAERAVSAGLLAVVPAAIAFPSQPLDIILAVSMVMHSHWGLEAVVTDYVRPVLFGNFVPKLAHILLFVFSSATMAGLLYFIFNDIGIGKAVRKLWSVKSQ
ncbi:Succinate dehydrogenase [ubiquinone] cytochrome b small subunit, mitochondrial [Pseudolycoriella hygida]|uniref:Succinate dehydrogenase [ubiquinone] cytochrome b small subunit n=1 Tax=Pseudolycoriella hygida TaxID=35572 RepID=A0A9Q0MTA4_9DIPT|nr:Succinate dehydrogenase [ubiquinone] cytochrome b small subunit, mitochondrial [Pseudolycoriella hygida]